MQKIFFTGWSISQEFFTSHLGEIISSERNLTIIDSTKIVAKYKCGIDKFEFIKEVIANLDKTILNKNNTDEIEIFGWSLGGLLATVFNLNSTLKINTLNLINASPNFTLQNIDRENSLNHLISKIQESSESRLDIMKKFYFSLLKNSSLKIDHNSFLLNSLLEQSNIYSENELVAALEFLRDINVTNELSKIKNAVNVFASQNDLLIPPDQSKIFQDKITNVNFRIIEDQGHLLPLESLEFMNSLL